MLLRSLHWCFLGAQNEMKKKLFWIFPVSLVGMCTIVLYKLLNCVTVKNIWKSTKNRPILMNKSLTETEWCHWLVKIRAKCSAKQKRKWAKLSAKLWGIKQKFSKTLRNQAKVQQNYYEEKWANWLIFLSLRIESNSKAAL